MSYKQPAFKAAAVRTPARQSYPFRFDADLKSITRILSFRRAPGTASFAAFCALVLDPVFGAPDQFGNYTLAVGSPLHAFVAHSDTVERKTGMVSLHVDVDQIIGVAKSDTTSACLGADCGAGIWIILEMIRAQRPGLYIICAEEETGCNGAAALAAQRPDLFAGIQSAIEFDRHDKNGKQVITDMVAGPVCSDDYADTLCALLGQGYKPSSDGLLTDVMEFMDILPNVTNISVGYQGHHTPGETLDFKALRALRDVMITADFSALPTTPKPAKPAATRFIPSDYEWAFPYKSSQPRGPKGWPDHDGWADQATWQTQQAEDRLDEMVDLILEHPYAIADLLAELGLDAFDIHDHLNRR